MEHTHPIFKAIFGDHWSAMPPVFHQHYANRANRNDLVEVTGTMSIWQSAWIKPASFLFLWTKTLFPVSANDLPASVKFTTMVNSNEFSYERTLLLPNGRTLSFTSKLEPLGGNQVVEWTGIGLGWHSSFSFEDGRVHLKHLGYRLRIGSFRIPMPLTWLIGRPTAREEAISNDEFEMEMIINHPLLGKIYSYSGRFKIKAISLDPK